MKNLALNYDTTTYPGRTFVGGEPLVFHCNHYNKFLQQTILAPQYIDLTDILQNAATEVAYPLLVKIFKKHERDTLEQKIKVAQYLFGTLGFGLIDFSGLNEEGGTVVTPLSHYGYAVKIANNNTNFAKKQNYFDAGYAAGAAAAIFDKPIGSYKAIPIKCFASGDDRGEIEISPASPSIEIQKTVREGTAKSDAPPEIKVESDIDEPAIIKAVSGLNFDADEEGLIKRFGVILTRHFANYYNRISYDFANRIAEHSGMVKAASPLLVEAGHVCAFNTFGGIMKSDEWYAVIHPMCQTKEDWVHGMVAVVNVLGWGTWRVEELVPDKRLVIRIYNSYESCGYETMYGKADHDIDFLATGGVSGLMNLIYKEDISQKPDLTTEFYDQVFNTENAFMGRQTKCQAKGDDYTEIVAER